MVRVAFRTTRTHAVKESAEYRRLIGIYLQRASTKALLQLAAACTPFRNRFSAF